MASAFAESRNSDFANSRDGSPYDSGGSSQNMAVYHANKAALGGRTINQRNLDEAARVGALGRDSSGNVVRDSSAYDRASNNQNNGNRTQDYVDMISDAAFGGPRGNITIMSTAHPPVPATMSPELAARRAGGQVAPIPATRSDQMRLEQALNNGATLEALAAGAAGAGVGYLAKSLLDRMANMRGETISPSSGVFTMDPPDLGPGNSGKGIPVVKGGGVTRVPQGTQQFGDPMDWFFTNGVIDGDFTDVTGMSDRGIPGPQDYRLVTGDDGITHEQGVPKFRGNDAIPGPDSRAKQLGDMDSPNFRRQMGMGNIDDDPTLDPYINQRAEEAYQVMQEYNVSDPSLLGITPENNPSLYDRLTRIMNPK